MQWFEGEKCRRRIATWIRDEARTADLGLMALGQSVNGPFGKVSRCGIPPLTIRRVPDTEGAGEIDHSCAALEERWRQFRRRCFGKREEDHIGFAHEAIHVERLHRAVPDASQGWQRARRAGGAGRHRSGQRHARMPCKDAHQFLSGIAGGAGNGDARQDFVGRVRAVTFERSR